MPVRAAWLPVAPGIADALVTARAGRPRPIPRTLWAVAVAIPALRAWPAPGIAPVADLSEHPADRAAAAGHAPAYGRRPEPVLALPRLPLGEVVLTAAHTQPPGGPAPDGAGAGALVRRAGDASSREAVAGVAAGGSGSGAVVRAAELSGVGPAPERLDRAATFPPSTGQPAAIRLTHPAASADSPADGAGPRSPRGGEPAPRSEPPAETPVVMARAPQPDPAPAPRLSPEPLSARGRAVPAAELLTPAVLTPAAPVTRAGPASPARPGSTSPPPATDARAARPAPAAAETPRQPAPPEAVIEPAVLAVGPGSALPRLPLGWPPAAPRLGPAASRAALARATRGWEPRDALSPGSDPRSLAWEPASPAIPELRPAGLASADPASAAPAAAARESPPPPVALSPGVVSAAPGIHSHPPAAPAPPGSVSGPALGTHLSPASASPGASPADPSALADELFEQLHARLRRELLVERERAGLLAGPGRW